VIIEGQVQLADYDMVIAAGGWLRARVETRQVTVRDQQLNVDFSRGAADLPMINAIKVSSANQGE
jgi:large repetitive protein